MVEQVEVVEVMVVVEVVEVVEVKVVVEVMVVVHRGGGGVVRIRLRANVDDSMRDPSPSLASQSLSYHCTGAWGEIGKY